MKYLLLFLPFYLESNQPIKKQVVILNPGYEEKIMVVDSITHYKGNRDCLWLDGVCKTADFYKKL